MVKTIMPLGAARFMRRSAYYRKYWTLLALAVVLIFVATLATGVTIWSLRSDAIDNAAVDANNIATVLSKQTASSIQSIDIVLRDLQEGLAASGVETPDDFQRVVSTKSLHELLADKLSRLSQAEVITLADRNGQIINFTRAWPVLPINLNDRDYFQYAKTNNDHKLYVSTPVPNRVTGSMAIYFSRRISSSSGDFLGIALVGVGLDYFQRIYDSINPLANETFMLLRGDGTIVLRHPDKNNHTGEKLPSTSPWYRQVANGGGNFRSTRSIDSEVRLVAVQPLQEYPLVINVSIQEVAALQAWRQRATIIGIGAAITLLSFGVLLNVLLTQYRNLMRSEESLAKRSRDLEEANVIFDVAVNKMPHGLCMFDAKKRLVICNELYAEMYRLPPELLKPGTPHGEIIAHRVRNGILKGDRGNVEVQVHLSALSALSENEKSSRIDEHSDGKLICITREPMESGGWVATHEDITEKRRAEEELDKTKRFLDSIIANIPVSVVVKDAKTRKFLLVNRAFETMLNLSQKDLVGKTVFDIYRNKAAEFVDNGDNETLRSSDGVNYSEYEVEAPARGTRVHATNRIVIRDAEGDAKYLIAVIDDVTERKRSEQQIAFMAHHDALTGLPNRAALGQKIGEAGARQRRFGDSCGVLLLDLDRFKYVNDTFGHAAGDALLREVAMRLKTSVRETDVLARLGGDEFAIIQGRETDQQQAASSLADRIIDIISKPFDIDGTDVHISASIGIALARDHATDADNLLKMADMALYSAKAAGRNGYRFFSPEMSVAASERQGLETELRRAIAQDELELHYQPIIDTKTGKVCSAEALTRWRHPAKGIIPPDQFIPLAEETGLITQIGDWVLLNACMEAVTWPASVKVAINLSPVQFRNSNLPDVVMYALAQSGLPPERLELEITETALIESAVDCLPVLRQFKNLGIAIALDDFGTGYSSLRQLTMFPFDKIKIDKSFTQNLTKRTECAAIISATLTLAQNLGIATTAEGIETAQQYQLLRLAGVTSVQGYLFKRPGPATEIDFDGVYNVSDIEDAA